MTHFAVVDSTELGFLKIPLDPAGSLVEDGCSCVVCLFMLSFTIYLLLCRCVFAFAVPVAIRACCKLFKLVTIIIIATIIIR